MYTIEKHTMRELVIKGSRHYNKRPALGWVKGKSFSYKETGDYAFAVSEKLKETGLTKGDKVAILSENRPEWGMAYLGITAGGFTAVPILNEFGADQIKNILNHAECKAAFVSDQLSAKALPICEGLTVIPIESILELPIGKSGGLDFPEISEDDIAAIIYTSGTTGNSKGVMLTHKNIIWDAVATRSIIRLKTSDVLLSVLPLAHTYECTIGFIDPLLQGSSIYYIDRPPSATVLLPALKAVRPTIMLSVPLLIEKVVRGKVLPELSKVRVYEYPLMRRILNLIAGLKLKKTFGGRMRFFGVGGAALSPDVEQFLSEARFPYAIGYGLTETAPLIAGAGPFRTKLRSTGPALRGVSLRIADPDPKTGEGEVQARGENVMKGYYKDPEKTSETFTPDGWFKTGDLGVFDTKMRLSIRGRLKTMILGPSGENIYPEEIESVLNQSAVVQESLVYDEKDGGLVALVHLKPETLEALAKTMDNIQGWEATAKENLKDLEKATKDILENIRKEVNARLASFSRIAKIKLQPVPFEKTPTQKIKRFLYPRKETVKAQ